MAYSTRLGIGQDLRVKRVVECARPDDYAGNIDLHFDRTFYTRLVNLAGHVPKNVLHGDFARDIGDRSVDRAQNGRGVTAGSYLDLVISLVGRLGQKP